MIERVPFEFHISSTARKKFNLDRSFFGSDGRVIMVDYSAAKSFSEQVFKNSAISFSPSDIFALGLIDESLHAMVRNYSEHDHKLISKTYLQLLGEKGQELDHLLEAFIEEYPPQAVFEGTQTLHEYLKDSTDKFQNKEIVLEEMLILRITNLNPAAKPFREFFDENPLTASGYHNIMDLVFKYFDQTQSWGDPTITKPSLIELLRSPALNSPDSLSGQLDYILENWGNILGKEFIRSLLRGMDFIRENKFRGNFSGGFAGDTPIIEFSNPNEEEMERFSQDKDWMPNLVLIAKNSYVWLDQLSRFYGREIRTLDGIPDEELRKLADSGITGLWLIGLWERSLASRSIKQIMGNPEAVASAYSLNDYQIAEDLGGWSALENLRERAWQNGIRLSADMVPNHMGIDSNWVINHPDWFLSLPGSPYPNYSYNGADLSQDQRVGIFLEDHYYDRSDAAVVFKRLDRWTGQSQFIYHGNDGTSMPWNDTAQLNYLKAEVREQVIQTILHVAKNFPIIRFDAAMTLAKRHIHRLWFPEPGNGGAIASRSEYGLTKDQFDEAIPIEFWREVVDRVAREAPDTLLLAEAFWMMEGFFVRTLGMHRVYNSAFMHMMRDEDNAKYRTLIKNTIEFDPEILKRYVNFMSNPDEKTAREQFGNGDKYFGVATLMSTLPGLPMIGHGQIEGFLEKYGMEYRRAYWNETPDNGFIEHHQQVIFPLLRKRYLFAGVSEFELFDFFTNEGVDENVFAYSNRFGSEIGLVIYHNKYAHTDGWIKISANKINKTENVLKQRSLSEVLDLRGDPNNYLIFRDINSEQEFIRSVNQIIENGLYLKLHAYQTHAFIDFRIVTDIEGKWRQVSDSLKGLGYWSIQARYDELFASKNDEVEFDQKKDPPNNNNLNDEQTYTSFKSESIIPSDPRDGEFEQNEKSD